LKLPNGTNYKGDFKNGRREGQGTEFRKKKGKYTGSWKNDKKHGKGTARLPNGARYQGDWFEGKAHGAGTMTLKSGKKLTGEFRDGKYVPKRTIETGEKSKAELREEAELDKEMEKLQED
jgi:hypothetical protein